MSVKINIRKIIILVIFLTSTILNSCTEYQKSKLNYIPEDASLVGIFSLKNTIPAILNADKEFKEKIAINLFPSNNNISFGQLKSSGINFFKPFHFVSLARKGKKVAPYYISGTLKNYSAFEKFLQNFNNNKKRKVNKYYNVRLTKHKEIYWNKSHFIYISSKKDPKKIFDKIRSLKKSEKLQNNDEKFRDLLQKQHDLKVWGYTSILSNKFKNFDPRLSLIMNTKTKFVSRINFKKGMLKANSNIYPGKGVTENLKNLLLSGMSKELYTKIPEDYPFKLSINVNLKNIKEMVKNFGILPAIENKMIMTGITTEELIKMLSGESFFLSKPSSDIILKKGFSLKVIDNYKNSILALGLADKKIFNKMMNKAVKSGIAGENNGIYNINNEYFISGKNKCILITKKQELIKRIRKNKIKNEDNNTLKAFRNHSVGLSFNYGDMNFTSSKNGFFKKVPVQDFYVGISPVKNNSIPFNSKISLKNKNINSFVLLARYLMENKSKFPDFKSLKKVPL